MNEEYAQCCPKTKRRGTNISPCMALPLADVTISDWGGQTLGSAWSAPDAMGLLVQISATTWDGSLLVFWALPHPSPCLLPTVQLSMSWSSTSTTYSIAA